MTMARPNMSQTWLQSISWHEPIFATCVAICTKPWRCPNVDAVIWEWLVHDLTISKLLAIPVLDQSSWRLQTRTDAPRLVVCREAFYFWLLDFKPWWCRDRGMVAPWSDNSQALCNVCTCTSQAGQRAAFIDARCTQNQPAWSFFKRKFLEWLLECPVPFSQCV